MSSLAVHTFVVMRWPGFPMRERLSESPQHLLAAAVVTPVQPVPPTLTPPIAVPSAARSEEPLPPTGMGQWVNIVERVQRPAVPTIAPELSLPQERPDKPSVPATIDLSNLSIELEKNPGYLEYFRTIRERIRYCAQRNYPATSRGGDVFVSFVVNASGHLQSTAVDAAHSAKETALHQASLESVRQAAPFPPFPSTFHQPQITFRIIIDYELSR